MAFILLINFAYSKKLIRGQKKWPESDKSSGHIIRDEELLLLLILDQFTYNGIFFQCMLYYQSIANNNDCISANIINLFKKG